MEIKVPMPDVDSLDYNCNYNRQYMKRTQANEFLTCFLLSCYIIL